MPSLKKRPTSVTIFACLVLIVAVIYLVRFLQTINNWQLLVEILPFSPVYLALSGIIWAIVGAVVGFGLLFGLPWLRNGMWVVLVIFEIYFWSDRLFIANYPERNVNWLFLVLINLLLVLWWLGLYYHPLVKNFFGVVNERRSENQETT